MSLNDQKLIQDVRTLIDNSGLDAICAFRLALKDINEANYRSAAARIQSDLDKVVSRAERDLLGEFVRKYVD